MCCKNLWKSFVPFFVALMIGTFAAKVSQNEIPKSQNQQVKFSSQITKNEQGRGCGGCSTNNFSKNESATKYFDKEPNNSKKKRLFIISKPRALYTEAARQKQTQGKVILNVTFLANGQVGNITPKIGLPDGLTEQSILAAKQIKFKPAERNGQPVTVTKVVEYNFTLY